MFNAIARLRSTLRSLTPSEIDGINELKLLFRSALEGKTLADLELEALSIETTCATFGARLTSIQYRAEAELLLARWAACTDAREARLGVLRVTQ